MVEDNFLQVGFNFVHLTQYDASLTFNLLLSEDAVLDDVRQDLHCPAVALTVINTSVNSDNDQGRQQRAIFLQGGATYGS